jgi:alpha-tubulin suppressor-like RCC1 family protein
MRIRIEHIGKSLAAVLALATMLGSCAYRHERTSGIDSSTNWLHACEGSSDCGDLACLCGVCNVTCGNNNACASLDSHAECSAASDHASCDEVAASVCVLPCKADRDCVRGLTCVQGLCTDATAASRDAGAPDYGFNLTQIAVGGRHACGLVSDGSMLCWGSNAYGAKAGVDSKVPMKQLAAGGYHTCGLGRDGSLTCWGGGALEAGQVEGPNADRRTGFTQVAAGNRHTCAIRDDKSLICWGNDDDGQVSGPNGDRGHDATQVTGGYAHTCELRSDGTLKCWGRDLDGCVSGPNGDGGSDFVQIAAGAQHTCALRTSGRLICWGSGQWVDEVSGPNADMHTNFVQVMTAAYQTCALRDDTSIVCWGDDSAKQVSGANAQKRVRGFVQLGGSIEVDGNFLCALTDGGTASCWGNDNAGQLSGLDDLARQPR